jgi:hypothetical protein
MELFKHTCSIKKNAYSLPFLVLSLFLLVVPFLITGETFVGINVGW